MRRLDRTEREDMLGEKKIFAPIWENGFLRGVGPRVKPTLALIPAFPDSALYEDARLKP